MTALATDIAVFTCRSAPTAPTSCVILEKYNSESLLSTSLNNL